MQAAAGHSGRKNFLVLPPSHLFGSEMERDQGQDGGPGGAEMLGPM